MCLWVSGAAPEFIGWRYRLDGLAEPMNCVRPALASKFLSEPHYSHGGVILVGVSFQVFIGSRYSLDGLAEPMNRVRPASASEPSSGRVIRTAGLSWSASASEFLSGRVIRSTGSQSR